MQEVTSQRRHVASLRVLGAALVLLAATACGGGDDGPSGEDATTPPGRETSADGTGRATPEPTAGTNANRLCEATAAEASTVESTELVEISGLAASRKNDGILWAHNDSGDTARLFAMTLSGEHRGTYLLQGADAIDWEDMAIGPGPDEGIDYLYLADIGDNNAVRADVQVYRVAEPAVSASGAPATEELTAVERLALRYPDGAHDAETLLVDSESGDLLIVTKQIAAGTSFVFRAPGDIAAGSAATLEAAGQFDLRQQTSRVQLSADAPPLTHVGYVPTGGDIAPSGDVIAIRTYSTVWLWDRPSGSTVADAFSSPPCEAPSTIESQGEAIAFTADGAGYITVSEGMNPPLHHFGVTPQ